MAVSGKAIHENVRRYRAIASLYRQTAAFRPHQSRTLLEQAEAWEHLALSELEAYFELSDAAAYDRQPRCAADAVTPWRIAAAA